LALAEVRNQVWKGVFGNWTSR